MAINSPLRIKEIVSVYKKSKKMCISPPFINEYVYMYAPKSLIIRWKLSEVNICNPHLNTINKKTTGFSQ